MPIKTVDIRLDEIGYPGWLVTMRTNPRASVYDSLAQVEDDARWWKAFGQVVESWNFVDENGAFFPEPKHVESEVVLDLPVSLVAYVMTRYFEAVREASAIPKAFSDNSVPISSTNGASLTTA